MQRRVEVNMSIECTTLINGTRFEDFSQFKPIITNALTQIYSSYNWYEKSGITGESDGSNNNYLTASLYFTTESYIKIVMYPGEPHMRISLVTPTATKEVFTQPITLNGRHRSEFFKMSIGKTTCGIGILAYGNSDTIINSRNILFYNLYVGEIIKLDGTLTKGCVYVADDGKLTIATDDGISDEIAQTSTINADKTAILTPVVDTTYGNVFKDIYFMRSSPLNCNIMAVEGQGNFLCGKTLCLKDQEVGV